ncbi:MAG: MogA/MoaB family molybdenum cofactor biosynthesis protein [Nitrospirota bacterium]|nr:MogA/MoaB family molybdenum cofactor biosynthesis protein [Nitrospirota bacterium]MDX2420771.1 MogA/MoaB family molybdenum cofactor biosynthesis protein [Nitrospirota bacterium]
MIGIAALMISTKIFSGQEPDIYRKALEETLANNQMTLLSYEVVPDQRELIVQRLKALCETEITPVILTLGGSGVRPTDWVPEATREVIDKEIPGIAEAMRAESLKKVRTAMLSRGIAGIKDKTVIINLPGSVKGIKENCEVVLPLLDHIVQKVGYAEKKKDPAISKND